MRFFYTAPAEGYVTTRGFVFRVRTEPEAAGKITRAWHGKILGGVHFVPRGTASRCHVRFAYYLNADGTRNVEVDPKRNLFLP